ncbi:hypothetical protein GCM10020331_037160 [Ectobacillus funiculus]
MMIDVGEEKGHHSTDRKMMINNIFEFNNKTVSDLMTHRTNIVGIPMQATLDELLTIMNTEKNIQGFQYTKNSLDNIIGILHVKDVIPRLEKNYAKENLTCRKCYEKPYFLPASRSTDKAFRDLQKDKVHIAIVIDEYGGTYGLITIEDLIEEIVGNIFDEHDEPEEQQQIKKIRRKTPLSSMV